MATSSITANFKITDPKAARAFVDGYTRFEEDLSPRLPNVRLRVLQGAAQIRRFFARRSTAK